MERKFRITYEIITPESAADGDVQERGWIDEEGVSMEPDKWDIEEGKTHIDLAVEFLLDNAGADGIEPSSYPTLDEGSWFTSYKFNVDYTTNEDENRSFHPVGFTADELNEIWRRVSR